MKTLLVVATAAATAITRTIALAQTGRMSDGGWVTGWTVASGGTWAPLLLIVVLGGLVAWVVHRERK